MLDISNIETKLKWTNDQYSTKKMVIISLGLLGYLRIEQTKAGKFIFVVDNNFRMKKHQERDNFCQAEDDAIAFIKEIKEVFL